MQTCVSPDSPLHCFFRARQYGITSGDMPGTCLRFICTQTRAEFNDISAEGHAPEKGMIAMANLVTASK